ncbi:MAG: RNA-binding protein [Thaumarchaeota archaeon]|nr:RNA-binding protein [Nitrososphaerota archaeon]
MKEHNLQKREVRVILDALAQTWPPQAIPQKVKQIRVVEVETKGEILILDGVIAVRTGKPSRIVPLLRENTLSLFPSITVDPGAIKFICNGADVMRPGVVDMTSFSQDSIVGVKERNYGKFIAVGIAVADSDSLRTASTGPVVKNIHYVGDKFWEVFKEHGANK